MKEVLIITNYYPPETGAAANRIFHLANGLSKRDYMVSVLAPLPNYPTGKIFSDYRGSFKNVAEENGIKVFRLWLFASNSKNKVLRLLAMLSYSFSLVWHFAFKKIPKTVIIQSPPLLVAFTAVFFLRSKKRKLILNVSDLWPRAGYELGAFKKNWAYRILKRIELFNYKKATVIFGQSEEIIEHVTSKVELKTCVLYRNYPDIKSLDSSNYKGPNDRIKIVYAGLLGVAQGILKLCENLNFEAIELHIYGAGAEKAQIEDHMRVHPEKPITYHGEISRELLHSELLKYDLAIIPLLKRIYGSVPSKIFEFSKLGLPLLYFGGGEGEQIISTYKLGWIAPAGNYNALNKVLSELKKEDFNAELRDGIKSTATASFDFNKQLDEIISEI